MKAITLHLLTVQDIEYLARHLSKQWNIYGDKDSYNTSNVPVISPRSLREALNKVISDALDEKEQ